MLECSKIKEGLGLGFRSSSRVFESKFLNFVQIIIGTKLDN